VAASTIDLMEYRKALGAFVTGVTIVTTLQSDGTPRGLTANSFTSVSLDPPLLLVCIGKGAFSYAVFSEASHFSVSVLAENQKLVSSIFASKAADKFLQVDWQKGPTGSPIINSAAAWFDCEMHEVIEAGDHVILIGRVVDFAYTSANPLGYCRGAYLTFSLSQDALATTGQHAKVGAILESSRGIVFVEEATGIFHLPTGSRLDPPSDPTSLRAILKKLKLDACLDFLFAVFEDAGTTMIFYRGRVLGDLPQHSSLHVVPLDSVPWAKLQDDAARSMLRRFVKERSEDTFGIYVGDADAGTVQPLAKIN
jgi:flavin reductase (DIM6/NTAB) family NADH-FMN oxidoreductase RutF